MIISAMAWLSALIVATPDALNDLRPSTSDMYAMLRRYIVARSSCDVTKLPQTLHFNEETVINAYADKEDNTYAITVSQGLLDTASVFSKLALLTAADRKQIFDAILAASGAGEGPLPFRQTVFYMQFKPNDMVPPWPSAFLSRMMFVLAHESGHICLGHLDGSEADESASLGTIAAGSHIRTMLKPRTLSSNAPMATDENRPFRVKEAAADAFAMSILNDMLNSASLESALVSPEHFTSMGAELALLDALNKRCTMPRQDVQFRHPVCYERYRGIVQRVVSAKLNYDTYLAYLSYLGATIYCLQNKADPIAVYQHTVDNKVFLCDEGTPQDTVAAVVPGREFAAGPAGFQKVAVAVANLIARPVLTAGPPSDKALAAATLLNEKQALQLTEARSGPALKVYVTRVPKTGDLSGDLLSFVGRPEAGDGFFEVTVDDEPATRGKVSGKSVSAKSLIDTGPGVASKIIPFGKAAKK